MAKQITAATVAVRLTAITGPLEKGFQSAQKTVAGFVKSVVSVKGAIAGALGVGGFGLFVKQSQDYIDALSKSAVKFGTTTKAFAGIQHAANLSGVEVSALSTAIKTMQSVVNKAARTGKDEGGIFAAMGLDPSKLTGMGPIEALAAVSDGLNRFGNSSARTAAAVSLFGRSGADLIPLFIGGGKAIRDAAADAEYLGLAIDDLSAIKVEAANDAWSRFKASLVGAGNIIAVDLAPLFKVLADSLADMVVYTAKLGPSLVDTFTKGADASIKFAGGIAAAYVGLGSIAAGDVIEGERWIAKNAPGLSNFLADPGGFLTTSTSARMRNTGESGPRAPGSVNQLSGAEINQVANAMLSETEETAARFTRSINKALGLDPTGATGGGSPAGDWVTKLRDEMTSAAEDIERARAAWRDNAMTLEDLTDELKKEEDALRKFPVLAPGERRGSVGAINAINTTTQREEISLLRRIEAGIKAMSRGIDDLRPIDVAFV